ncbi:coiled-coil domain-containing protein 86 [Cololabis saira]|uniref:coiled-coil domain-containing protein 86 n=1 Tax=Cololabis saira TaxID=129043 RepID=UPI002AD444E0|nr:coiled-coil domain-containing protein 86 [Cololabis saira]
MPKRVKVVHEEEARGPEQVEDVPAETRRTRSGRRIRAPASQPEYKPPATPGRRTRSSVAQERVAAEDKIVEEPERSPERPVETKSAASPEPAAAGEQQVQVQADPGAAETVTVSRPPAAETAPLNSETVPKKKPHLAPSAKKIPAVPLGKPKSGRVWKDRNKQRFSALVRDKPLNSSWEKKMAAKREKQLLKQYSVKLTEEKARQKEEKRLRREENLKRRAENERKSEIVQVIRNTTKIKRMKKKQLRKIEKRDTLALLQKSQKQNKKTKTQKNVEQELT